MIDDELGPFEVEFYSPYTQVRTDGHTMGTGTWYLRLWADGSVTWSKDKRTKDDFYDKGNGADEAESRLRNVTLAVSDLSIKLAQTIDAGNQVITPFTEPSDLRRWQEVTDQMPKQDL